MSGSIKPPLRTIYYFSMAPLVFNYFISFDNHASYRKIKCYTYFSVAENFAEIVDRLVHQRIVACDIIRQRHGFALFLQFFQDRSHCIIGSHHGHVDEDGVVVHVLQYWRLVFDYHGHNSSVTRSRQIPAVLSMNMNAKNRWSEWNTERRRSGSSGCNDGISAGTRLRRGYKGLEGADGRETGGGDADEQRAVGGRRWPSDGAVWLAGTFDFTVFERRSAREREHYDDNNKLKCTARTPRRRIYYFIIIFIMPWNEKTESAAAFPSTVCAQLHRRYSVP